MIFSDTLQFVQQLDSQDPLRHFRDEFVISDPNTIYMDGNSLGRLPRRCKQVLEHVIAKEWGEQLIHSWNEGWYERAAQVGGKIARLIGAHPDEVIVSDSTSINLYKLAFAAMHQARHRFKVVSDEFNFPSDLYILQGILQQMGPEYNLELIPSRDGIHINSTDVKNALDLNTSLLTLSHVAFKSAFQYDLQEITELAHEAGAWMLWDLSHSVGAVPIDLHKANVDLAIGCTYKYLNGGPGAPAFLYVRRDLQEQLSSPMWGWFGERAPFEFTLKYRPAETIKHFMVGTPSIISLSAIEPAVDVLLDAGLEKLRQKSMQQTEYLLFLTKQWLQPLGFRIGSPEEPEHRGSHVSLLHEEGYRICQALIEPEDCGYAVIPDFREPDNIRLGIAPLYTTFSDIYFTLQKMAKVTKGQTYLNYSNQRTGVT